MLILSYRLHRLTPHEGVDKAIIVITDAENHEDDAVQMAKAAAEKNIKVDVIGIGSLEGVPIIERVSRPRTSKGRNWYLCSSR